jgi:hypothetical protein
MVFSLLSPVVERLPTELHPRGVIKSTACTAPAQSFSFRTLRDKQNGEPLSGGNLLLSARAPLHPIDILRSGIDSWEQCCPLKSPERGLGHSQPLPDSCRRILPFLEAFRRRGAESHGGDRRFDDVGGAKRRPVFTRALREGDEPIPLVCSPLHCLGCHFPIVVYLAFIVYPNLVLPSEIMREEDQGGRMCHRGPLSERNSKI